MTNVDPKPLMTGIVCPHCRELTNASYRWHPALDCWSCGGVMWRDDYGRTIGDRRKLAERGALVDTEADQVRSRRANELGGESQ